MIADLPGLELGDSLSEIVGKGRVPGNVEDDAEERNTGSRQSSCQLNSYEHCVTSYERACAQVGLKCKLTWTTRV